MLPMKNLARKGLIWTHQELEYDAWHNRTVSV